MAVFTINRGLCEVEYENINLENIDVDVMEYIWFKIRDRFEYPTDSIDIGFTEIKKSIGRYAKDSFISSVQRLDGVSIVTNQKSYNPSQQYRFNFRVSNNKKHFVVGLDKNIFGLFDKPISYSEYHQHHIYQFNEKYSKLLYKFLIGYKLLKGKSIFVESDVLMKVLNVYSENPMSKIQSNIFYSSVKKINAKTDLNITLEKEAVIYKNDTEIVKYKLTVNDWKRSDEMKGSDLKRKKTKGKSNEVQRIDKWIENAKSEFDVNDYDETQIPMVVLRKFKIDCPIYIDNKYTLIDTHGFPYSKNPMDTLIQLNKWISDDILEYEVRLENRYKKEYQKMCLLSEDQLKQRGVI